MCDSPSLGPVQLISFFSISHCQNVGQAQRSVAIQPLLKRLASNVRHHEIRQLARGIHRVNRHDVRMNDGGGCLRLASESLSRLPLVARCGAMTLTATSRFNSG